MSRMQKCWPMGGGSTLHYTASKNILCIKKHPDPAIFSHAVPKYIALFFLPILFSPPFLSCPIILYLFPLFSLDELKRNGWDRGGKIKTVWIFGKGGKEMVGLGCLSRQQYIVGGQRNGISPRQVDSWVWPEEPDISWVCCQDFQGRGCHHLWLQ